MVLLLTTPTFLRQTLSLVFEPLNWGFLFSVGERVGIPSCFFGFCSNYLGRLQRFFIFGVFFDPSPCLATRGVPQGDALSLIWAAIGLSVWAKIMDRSSFLSWDRLNSGAPASIDDRHVLANDHKNLYRLLKQSIEHDKLAVFGLT
jgi:hypothetical protein